MYFIVAFLIFILCLSISIFTKNFRFLTVWNYFLAYVILNIVLRSLFIEFELGSFDPWKRFLKGLTDERLIFGVYFYLYAIFFLCLGYMSIGNRLKITLWPKKDMPRHFSRSFITRLQWKLVFLLLVSIFSFGYYLTTTLSALTSIETLKQLSGHRGVTDNIDDYTARGYIRFLVNLSGIVSFISFYLLLNKKGNYTLLLVLLVISFVVFSGMAIFTSSRASVVLLFLQLTFLSVLVTKRKVGISKIIFIITITTSIFFFMTIIRTGEQISYKGIVNLAEHIISAIVLNNSGLDISKTILVKNYVDNSSNYQLGATLFLFIVLAVPRTFWPNKPVNLDTFIGHEVYGETVYGSGAVPPGFPAEMYLNLNHGGVILGMLALGMISRMIHNDFAARRDEPFYAVYFVLITLSFLYSVMGSGFSSYVVGMLMILIPLRIVLR